MKLKYFLRGLGIGVIVTTIILSIAHASANKMSDADIIERAKELGMVYDSLFDNTGNKETESGTAESTTAEGEAAGSDSTESTSNQEETEASQNQSTEVTGELTQEQSSEAAGSDNIQTEEAATAETTADPSAGITTDVSAETTSESIMESSTAGQVKELATQVDENGVIIFQLEVIRGMKSAEVAALVEAAGIVDSAKELDSFLIAGDYDNQINIGIFTIKSDMTYEDIAGIITGK